MEELAQWYTLMGSSRAGIRTRVVWLQSFAASISFLANFSSVGAGRQDVPKYEWSIELEIAWGSFSPASVFLQGGRAETEGPWGSVTRSLGP